MGGEGGGGLGGSDGGGGLGDGGGVLGATTALTVMVVGPTLSTVTFSAWERAVMLLTRCCTEAMTPVAFSTNTIVAVILTLAAVTLRVTAAGSTSIEVARLALKLPASKVSTVPATVILRTTLVRDAPPGVSGGGEAGGGEVDGGDGDGDGGGRLGDGGGGLGDGGIKGEGGGGLGDGGGGKGDGGGGEGEGGGDEGEGGGGLGEGGGGEGDIHPVHWRTSWSCS